jgi:hypothetical protein
MRMIGAGKAKLHVPEDEGPHVAGANEFWQESVVLHWYDARHDIGGYLRIGHEPNLQGGLTCLWCSCVNGDGTVFNHNEKFAMTAADRISNGFAVGDVCRFEFDGDCPWTVDDKGYEAKLVAKDIHQPIDLYPSDTGTLSDDYCKDHLEVASRVTGTVYLDGNHYDIDGFGYRDHSWGVRRWQTLLTHRWVTGVLGPTSSFGCMSWHAEDNTLNIWGYLIRGDAVHYATAADVVTFVEQDGLTHRGGIVYMSLPDGEKIEIHCKPIGPGAMSSNQGMFCLDVICVATCGDLVGYCDFETSVNPLRGTHAPTKATYGILDNGLFHFPARMYGSSVASATPCQVQ